MEIAVPLSDKGFKENVLKAKEKGADIIELRVDQFSRTDVPYVTDLVNLVKSEGLKTILTVRWEKEGGKPVKNREEIFLKAGIYSDFVDVELNARDTLLKVSQGLKPHRVRLIVSFHDFERTPPPWIIREILREGHRLGGIPKVSVMAKTEEDVANLLCVGHKEKYEKILIAMGEVGKISRVAGFVFGSVISYASLEETYAPGQLSLEEMVKLRKLFCEGKVDKV